MRLGLASPSGRSTGGCLPASPVSIPPPFGRSKPCVKSYRYPNTVPVTPVAVLSPCDTVKNQHDKSLAHLPDSTSWENMRKRAVYDGNMETSYGSYKTIRLALTTPRVVTRIRFVPRNADNGIRRGHDYELMYWDDGWQSCGLETAKYEYLQFRNVPLGKLYWLKNLNTGKEELPFLLHDGQQQFIYEE